MNNFTYDVTRTSYLPCASSLKPIFVWLALRHPDLVGDISDINLAAIITHSDNAETDKLIVEFKTLDRVTILLNSLLESNGSVYTTLETPHTWGQYLINAQTLNNLYHLLLASEDDAAMFVKEQMAQVHHRQRFGLGNDAVLKAGWDLTHDNKLSLLIVALRHKDVGVFTGLTGTLSQRQVRQWKQLEEHYPECLPAIHRDYFEKDLRSFRLMLNWH